MITIILITSQSNIESVIRLCIENERFSAGIAFRDKREKDRLIGRIQIILKWCFKNCGADIRKSDESYAVHFKNGSIIRLAPASTDARGSRYNALLVPVDVDAEVLYTRLLPQQVSYYPFRR